MLDRRLWSRSEKVAYAQKRRAQGALLREIAAEMDCSLKTVHAWLADPDLSRQAARREWYVGTCEVCGGPTTGCNGATAAPSRCRICFLRGQHEERRWTPDAVLEAMRSWRDELGHWPSATGLRGRGAGALVVYAQREFGSWSAALRAAGHVGRIDTGRRISKEAA